MTSNTQDRGPLPENVIGPMVTIGDPKSGWCNGCSERPPYVPNETTQIRSKTMVLAYCPKCTLRLTVDLMTHIRDRGMGE